MEGSGGAARLVVVDDHRIVRQGLRALLELDGGLEVVAEAGSREELLEVLASTACDCVLLDLRLPDTDGLSCVAELSERWPGLPILVLSMESEPRVVEQALRAGARGYLPKQAGVEEIRQGLATVLRGGIFLHQAVSHFLAPPEAKRPGAPALSQRERDVLDCISRGMTNKQVASELNMAPSTVKTHLRSLFDKVGVSNRAELVSCTFRRGLLADDGRPPTGDRDRRAGGPPRASP